MSEAALIEFVRRAMMHDSDPLHAIVDEERRRNPSGEIIRVGHHLLPRRDWNEAVVTLIGDRARIVLVDAAKPGCGAFTRLLDALAVASVSPVVISPTTLFQMTLQRRGWSGRCVGRSFNDREWQWVPPASQSKNRRPRDER